MTVTILNGDCREVLKTLAAGSFDCAVSSPPYWGLRDYGHEGQIGLEPTLDAYVAEMVDVGREMWRVLKPEGTFWLNLGDCYAGSWGAQSRGHETPGTLEGSSMLSARQILAHPKGQTGTGSGKRTPGLKPKDLCMVPARVALALQSDGWWVRSEIIWHKPNPMPESVSDRPTSAHEKVFLLTKSEQYFYDADAIREPLLDSSVRRLGRGGEGSARANGGTRESRPMKAVRKRGTPPRHSGYESSDQSGLDDVGRGYGSNARNVWTIATKPFKDSHFATMPPDLAERCILAGCPVGGHVLDPFGGAGTTGMVADRLGRHATLIELNPAYGDMAAERVRGDARMFADVK